ncbi:LysR family transcriptional regulator [Nakamurella silvestris]|nr:LysR family transcriptional regulator [Nakamurella silvestris]
MELRQLEYFLAVAEEQNFTRAAERVHISQSGVSAQIRQLEHDVGSPLFDRSGRVVTLTTAGKALLDHARDAVAAVAAGRQAVDEVGGLLRGSIVVGMPAACTVTGLFDALSTFHRAHPQVEISLLEDTSDRHLDGVRAGTTDLALVGVPGPPPPDLDALVVVSERLAAVFPVDHPFAGQDRLTLADLTGTPVICMPAGTGIRTVFDRCCAAAGLTPTIAFQASAPATVADLAFRGLGVAVLSESMAAEHEGRLATALITDAVAPALLALVWKPGSNPARRQLVDHARRIFHS